MESVLIFIPPSLSDQESISVRVQNGAGVGQIIQDLIVTAGSYVEIDLTELPDQFFNPYAGTFTVEFLDSDERPVTFTADNGRSYDSIRVKVANIPMNTGVIDAFGNESETYPY